MTAPGWLAGAERQTVAVVAAIGAWSITQPLPAVVTPAALAETRDEIERLCAPASDEAAAVVMYDLVAWMQRKGLPVPGDGDGMAMLVADYVEGLADAPADLLAKAAGEIRRTWHWRTVPLEGDLRQLIAEDMALRRLAAMRLRTAASVLARPMAELGSRRHDAGAVAVVRSVMGEVRRG
ncbi:hypothetical protein P7L78_22040 [Tistrella bauzanensis]|uniref:hypothetical protein n=1 Tax=Tistrella TaxID=171436 RepID=UPI0031F6CC1D